MRKIEDDVDVMLRAHLAKSGNDEESGPESLAQRLDNLVHHRRVVLSARPISGGDGG